MSGNAMEEGLIQQIHNPSHTDPSRFGFLAGALSGIASMILLSVIFPNLPRLLTVYLSLAVTALIGTLITRRITRARKVRDVNKRIQMRKAHQAETVRKIALMKAGEIRDIAP